jgi:tRNA (guanine37-N1)-methyltransferase
VLLGGNHADIRKWRAEQRKTTTRERRPDLWATLPANQQAKGAPRRGKEGKPSKDDDR